MRYNFRTLSPADLPQMHLAFNHAFADYKLPFQLNFPDFVRKFVVKLNINFGLSIGAYYQNQLVGFIFSSVAPYQGKITAYNGGSGVVPEHRGNHLTVQMYDHLIPLLKKEGVEEAILEVLTDNRVAIHNYQKCGFSISNLFHCFRIDKNLLNAKGNPDIHIRENSKADWNLYRTFYSMMPSFLDSEEVLRHNLQNEILAEAIFQQQIVGFVIFQPQVSRISQIGVDENYRERGIGSSLIQHVVKKSLSDKVTLINVKGDEADIVNAFKAMGFRHTVDQYEMVKPLK